MRWTILAPIFTGLFGIVDDGETHLRTRLDVSEATSNELAALRRLQVGDDPSRQRVELARVVVARQVRRVLGKRRGHRRARQGCERLNLKFH